MKLVTGKSRVLSTVVVLSALSLTAFAAGCTISTNPVEPPPAPAATADAGPSPATPAATGCDFGEPNDAREQAKAIELNKVYASLCVSSPSGTDILDFFEITAPAADVAGGVVEIQISNVQNAALAEVIVTSSLDNGVIFDTYTTDPGASVSGWLTVTPGAKYRIQVNRFGGAGDRFAYDLLAKYTKVVDAYEPNDKKEQAKDLALDTTIEASAAASSAKADLQVGDDQDWFKVTLGAGNATVKMSNVASDFMCDVELFDGAGQKVDEKYETTPGADCTIDAKDLTGGTYYVNVHAFAGLPIRGAAHTPVASFALQPYKLVVQQ